MRAGIRRPRGGPGASSQHGDLPDGGGRPDQPGQDRGGGEAADGDRPAPVGIIGQGAATEAGRSGEPIGDPFDEAQALAGAPKVVVSRLGRSAVGTS